MPFRHFGRDSKLKNHIPKPDQLDAFLNFMERTLSDTMGVAPWISAQHAKAVPSSWHTWHGFKDDFAKRLDAKLRPAFQRLYDNSKGQFSWPKVVAMLAGVFDEMLDGGAKTKTRWLAQMIIADMDAVFDKPFGICRPEDLVMGYGSASCLIFFRNGDLYRKQMVKGWKKKGKKAHKNDVAAKAEEDEANDFADVLHDIIKYVNDPQLVPDKCLWVAGYKRTTSGDVVNLVNGALFDAKDAEHWMCKLYYQVKFTAPNYLGSVKPMATKHYCWPQRFRQEDANDINQSQEALKKLMELACSTFLEVMHEGTFLEQWVLSLPDIVILQNEVVEKPPHWVAAE